jgi:hypothetical protein
MIDLFLVLKKRQRSTVSDLEPGVFVFEANGIAGNQVIKGKIIKSHNPPHQSCFFTAADDGKRLIF